jgi:hypothetical protein
MRDLARPGFFFAAWAGQMTLILGFAPFILFVLLSRLSGDLALWTAFAAAFVVTIRDFVERPALRLLDGVSLTVFGLLALGRGFFAPDLPLAAVRTIVDVVLGLAIAFSILRRQPFSLQYASGQTGGRVWPLPLFVRVNYVISLTWLGAFAAMTLADGAVTFTALPPYVGVAVSVIAVGAAVTLTLRYPGSKAARLS